MRNPIDIDYTHSRAICREIGERLQQYLRAEAELPAAPPEGTPLRSPTEDSLSFVTTGARHAFN